MSNLDYSSVNYLNCNSPYNTLYFIWGIPIINIIALSIIIALFMIIVIDYNSNNNQFILNICLIFTTLFIHHNLTFNQIEKIKTDCINYGKNIIIPKNTNKKNLLSSAPVFKL